MFLMFFLKGTSLDLDRLSWGLRQIGMIPWVLKHQASQRPAITQRPTRRRVGWMGRWVTSSCLTWQRVPSLKGQPFFSPLKPFFSPLKPFFHLHLSFSPSEPSFFTLEPSFLTLDQFFFTLLPLLGALVGWLACCHANQISTAFGENTGLCGFG